MEPPEKVLVVGASGALGRAVVAALKRRGRWVRGTSRDPARVPAEADEAVRADLLDDASLRAACAGADAVVHAAGASVRTLAPRFDRRGFRGVDAEGTARLVEAARAAGVRRFVYVSVFGPPDLDAVPYVAAHREAEAAVRAGAFEATVVRPTGFFSAYEAYLPLARLGFLPRSGRPDARTNPIHPADLAEVVADALDSGAAVVEAGGPEVLTREAIGRAAFAAVGRRPRFVPVPDAVARVQAAAASVLDRRVGELLGFVRAIHQTDLVTPAHGTYRLGPYLAAAARRPSGDIRLPDHPIARSP
jgi:uncharacterized protein YbjT (DUF2867 family)